MEPMVLHGCVCICISLKHRQVNKLPPMALTHSLTHLPRLNLNLGVNRWANMSFPRLRRMAMMMMMTRTRMRTRARTTDSGSSELLFQLSAAGIEGQMTVGPESESLKEQIGGRDRVQSALQLQTSGFQGGHWLHEERDTPTGITISIRPVCFN